MSISRDRNYSNERFIFNRSLPSEAIEMMRVVQENGQIQNSGE